MSLIKGKRILIFQQRGWGKAVGRPIAKMLYDQGARLAALTFRRATHQGVVLQQDVHYDLIINDDEIRENPKKFLADTKISLEEICKDLGIDSVWPLIYAMRLYVYSYKEKYYYSFSQYKSDEEMADYIKAFYKCAKLFFDEFNPDIVIAPAFVATPHLIFNLYAEKHGVKMLAFSDSKIKDMYISIYDYKESAGPFFDRLNLLNNGQEQSENIEKARRYIQEFNREFKKIDPFDYFPQKTLVRRIKDELVPYAQALRWMRSAIKRRDKISQIKNIGPTSDNRSPKIILRDHYCAKAYKKFMEKFNYYPLDKLNKFVYFPLQHQPETLLECGSPYASNQIEMARQTAMSLPDDYTLVAKEHPAMIDKRRPSYIKKLVRTPNVKLIDYRISNETILKRADLIVNPGGTTVSEAAFLAAPKPVIQTGNMGTTLKLPNVFKHTDMTTLASKIKEVLAIELNTPEYQRRLENYVAAVYDTGYPLDYRRIFEQDMIEVFCRAFQKEIERVLKNQLSREF